MTCPNIALPPLVAETFGTYEPDVRDALLKLRGIVFETAEETDGVGELEETLKWGQPSYLTSQSRSGSTIRIAPLGPDDAHDYAMFFICHTNLVDRFEVLFGDTFVYASNRALLFSLGDELPIDELRQCITLALAYHLNKR